MRSVLRRGHSRRFLSGVVTVAMVLSLIVVPAHAAQPSTAASASIVPGGTNLTTIVDVTQCSNGLNGQLVVSIDAAVTTAKLFFIGSQDASFGVGVCTLGHIDPFDGFVAGQNASGEYTAVKLPAGYDLCLCTDGTQAISQGDAVVTVSGGLRDETAPAFEVTMTPGPAEVGSTAVVTATFTPADTAGESGIDGVSFTLPEGFVPTQTAAAAAAGSDEASVVVDPVSRTVTVSHFFAKGSDALVVDVTCQVPTAVGDYGVDGTYKNIGGAATPKIGAQGVLEVRPIDSVSAIQFTDDPMTGRPGATVVVGAKLLDTFGNEVPTARVVRASATSTMAPTQTTTATADAFYGYKSAFRLPLKTGVTTVKYSVYADDTTTTVEASDTVTVSTLGVGAPAKLGVLSSENPAAAASTVAFRVQLLDASGNVTAYRPGELPGGLTAARATLCYGPKASVYATAAVTIPDGYGEQVVSLTSAGGDTTWTIWAIDRDGMVERSADLTQVWTQAVIHPNYGALSVEATRAIAGYSDYGVAKANGSDAVTFVVRTNVPKAGVRILAAPANNNSPGVLDSTSAFTDASGVATFTVRSNTPSLNGDSVKFGRAYKQFVFTDAAQPSIGAYGYAHFYTSQISKATVSKRVAFAGGTDKVTYTFTVVDPLTGSAVPTGTRIYFAAAGWDSGNTTLSSTSGLTDGNGKASVDVSRVTGMTLYDQVTWVVAQDYSRFSISQAPPNGVPSVQFMEYIASADTTITGQQSTRGAAVAADLVIRDSAGKRVAFTRLTGMIEATGTDLLKASPLTYEIRNTDVHIAAEVRADDVNAGIVRVAGDVVHACLNGQATVPGPLNSEVPIAFGVDLPLHIVNNASVTGMGSVYLGKANITGYNLKPGTASIKAVQNGITYTLTGTTIAIDPDGAARPQLFDLPFTMLKGTYDLVIDGMTFPGALVVGDGIGIGVQKVIIRMGASRGVYPYYASLGSEVTLFGVVSTLGNANIPSAIVSVYSSTTSQGANPVFIGSVLTSNGQFAYRVTADRGKYYFATTEANTLYAAGDSRISDGSALFIGVKTRATLKWTSAPLYVYAGRYFTVKGAVPAHMYATSVGIRMYRYQSGRWVYKYAYTQPIAAGQKTFYRSVKLNARGPWRMFIVHSDYDHVPSVSAYRGVTAR